MKKTKRGLFYHRDSGGEHQTTPPQYLKWAVNKSKDLGVTFNSKPSDIKKLMNSGMPHDGRIYFDYGVEGDVRSRPALDALLDTLRESKGRFTHVFIPDPDRLSRPDHPMQGIAIEEEIRRLGVAIVYKNKTLPALERGQRPDIGQLIGSVVDYDRSGSFLHSLAEKMVESKISCAEQGRWTGGRVPYGFRRWQVRDDGTPIRQLSDGEPGSRPGHHVEALPYEPELKIVKRILKLLKTNPATEVCRILNREKIPSPNAGRIKTINGVKQKVSGIWNPTTIMSIARNDLLLATVSYGKRSMGKKRRLSSDGPRSLTDNDFRPDGRPKVIRNPKSVQVAASAAFEPIVDIDEHAALIDELDRRGASQRNKRKCQRPEDNPLGGRIIDMACHWPMYKTKYQKNKQKTFKYRCGAYDKSKGELCEHNCIDGPTAIKFVLKTIQQRILQPGVWDTLESKIRAIKERDFSTDSSSVEEDRIASRIAELNEQLDLAAENMALAKNPRHLEAMSGVYDKLIAKKESLAKKLQESTRRAKTRPTLDAEIQHALEYAQRISDLDLDNTDDYAMAREVITSTNAQLFVRFRKEKWGRKREVNRMAGGVITFGTAAPPITKYDGPTDREYLRKLAKQVEMKRAGAERSAPEKPTDTSEEAGLSGCKSRGDWI